MAGLHITVVPVDPEEMDELSAALWGKMVRTTGGGGLRR
jgi:hypothetical protein